MIEDIKFDKNGYVSTWSNEDYEYYYSEARKERREKEREYFKMMHEKELKKQSFSEAWLEFKEQVWKALKIDVLVRKIEELIIK